MAELQHYGILGMRWGVRRQRGPSGLVTDSPDYRESRELKARGTSALSTAELKTLTNRLQLEMQYKNLNKSKTGKGLDTVKKITAAGTTVAALYGLSKTPLGQDVIKAFKRARSSKAMDIAYRRAMGG